MKTPITYYGGKQILTHEILELMPAHKIYVEPFFGGGAIFFAKGSSFLEVINDTNDLLINCSTGSRTPFTAKVSSRKPGPSTTIPDIGASSIRPGLFG